MLIYPIHLEPDDNGTILASFPDVPEAVTYGDDAADAVNHAVGSLTAMFSAYMDDRQRIPMPSPLKGRPGVVLPVGVSAKILLWNVMFDAGLRKADLARKLDLSSDGGRGPASSSLPRAKPHRQEIETALAALGKKLVVGVREAA